MQQIYVERFHIVNKQELYMDLKMNVDGDVVVVVAVEQLNRREKNEEEVQQQW